MPVFRNSDDDRRAPLKPDEYPEENTQVPDMGLSWVVAAVVVAAVVILVALPWSWG